MDKSKIQSEIIAYLKLGNPTINNMKKIPLNEYLVEKGYLDSFGIIESLQFIEKNFKIKILDEEVSREKIGTINKMTDLVFKKINT